MALPTVCDAVDREDTRERNNHDIVLVMRVVLIVV
jgi:hypothetical protein